MYYLDPNKKKELEELGFEIGTSLKELLIKYPEYIYYLYIYILLIFYNLII